MQATTAATQQSERLNVALAAGLGAAGGAVFDAWLGSARTWGAARWIEFAVLTAIGAWVSARYLDPWIERRRLARGQAPRHPEITIRGVALRGPAAAVVVAVTFEFYQGMVTDGPLGYAFGVWLGSFVIVTAITRLWIAGAHRQPSRTAAFGAVGGALVSSTLVAVLLRMLGRGLLPGDLFAAIVVTTAVAWGLYGLAGGLAIERWHAGRVGARVIVAVAAGVLLLGLAVEVADRLDLVEVEVNVLQHMLIGVGWGVGLLLYPASDALLGRPRG